MFTSFKIFTIDMPKIKKMIKDIEASLANFNQLKANKLIAQTSNYI